MFRWCILQVRCHIAVLGGSLDPKRPLQASLSNKEVVVFLMGMVCMVVRLSALNELGAPTNGKNACSSARA